MMLSPRCPIMVAAAIAAAVAHLAAATATDTAPLLSAHLRLRRLVGQSALPSSYSSSRALQDNETCSEDPFLWLIQKDTSVSDAQASDTNSTDGSSMETVGFAVGSMHLGRDFVLSDTAWASMTAAAMDSCAIYGEIDITDSEIVQGIVDCTSSSSNNQATLSDIPDSTLRDEYAAIMNDIATEYGPNAASAEAIADQFMQTLSIMDALELVYVYNTPGYRDTFFEFLFSVTSVSMAVFPSVDADLLSQGRPSAGLETLEETCQLLDQVVTLTTTEFLQDYETEYAGSLQQALTVSYTPFAESYRCGDLQEMSDLLSQNLESVPQEIEDALLGERNTLMADRMVQVLDTSTQRPMFAVGLAHWIDGGEDSLEALLANEGYTLKRVEGTYDPEMLQDISDDVCREAEDDILTFAGMDVDQETASASSTGSIWRKFDITVVTLVAAAVANVVFSI